VNVEAQLRNQSSQLWSTRLMLEMRRNSEALTTGDFALIDSSNPPCSSTCAAPARTKRFAVFNFSRYPQATTVDWPSTPGTFRSR
jgi:hypothetical protein